MRSCPAVAVDLMCFLRTKENVSMQIVDFALNRMFCNKPCPPTVHEGMLASRGDCHKALKTSPHF